MECSARFVLAETWKQGCGQTACVWMTATPDTSILTWLLSFLPRRSAGWQSWRHEMGLPAAPRLPFISAVTNTHLLPPGCVVKLPLTSQVTETLIQISAEQVKPGEGMMPASELWRRAPSVTARSWLPRAGRTGSGNAGFQATTLGSVVTHSSGGDRHTSRDDCVRSAGYGHVSVGAGANGSVCT